MRKSARLQPAIRGSRKIRERGLKKSPWKRSHDEVAGKRANFIVLHQPSGRRGACYVESIRRRVLDEKSLIY